MLHEEFPERVFITIIPYVREISARIESLHVNPSENHVTDLRDTLGKSEQLKLSLSLSLSLPISFSPSLFLSLSLCLSLSCYGQKGFINQFSRYNARLCLGEKPWFNSAHNCSPGIAESPRVRINTRRSASLYRVFRFDNSSRTFWLVHVLRHNR